MRSTFVPLVLLVVLAVPARAATPTEASLLEAWEAAQRADPKTVAFERTGDRTYRFETTRFPFKGELKVVNLSLDEVELPAEEGAAMGAVEVELAGVDSDFLAKHARSYGSWQAGNVMYFDGKAGRWLTGREWQRDLQKRYAPWSGLLSFGNLFFIGLLLLLLVLLLRVSRKANTQFKSAMALQERALAEHRESLASVRRSLELAEDSNRVLHDILEELKTKR